MKIALLSALFSLLVIILFFLWPTAAVSTKIASFDRTVSVPVRKALENTAVFESRSKLAKGGSYNDKDFSIEYSGSTVAYFVTINASKLDDFRRIKKDAERVFIDSGMADLCKIRIFFEIPSALKNKIDGTDLFSSGCDPKQIINLK